jgi:hypothetical protein
MTGFLDITQIKVPSSAAQEANDFLKLAGQHNAEGFALWSGRREGTVFSVESTIIPKQTAYLTETGVCVSVGAEELHRLNVWLYTQKLSLIAQLHSHPEGAYHSETDDTFPIATTIGCLSLVIPDFARFPFSLSRCAIYRLTAEVKWAYVPPRDAEQLITIV